MLVNSLKLVNYRNYNNTKISFSDKINIIYGNNGQGKTNILEAIFLCASGRSHRTSKDSELVKAGEEGYYVKLDVKKQNIDSSIEILYKLNEKRRIKINEIPITKIGEMIGHLNVVIFSPEDLLVIKEGPSERRRFIDITLSQLKPSYFYDLQQYSKILLHRNNLLKEVQGKKSLINTLEIWNNSLVKTGSKIIKARNDFIENLSQIAARKHYILTNQDEKFNLKYNPSVRVGEAKDVGEIENVFNKTIEGLYYKELLKCTTLCGPQRDDYEIFINNQNIKIFGSQGQQRTAILSVKMAEIDIMKENTGEKPVLLLDDVMSELDSKRQDYLIENVKGIQTFITSTDKNIYKNRNDFDLMLINIKEGKVQTI